MNLIATAEMQESFEFEDVILRIKTMRGSSPIVIVDEGKVVSAETIGLAILAQFGYLVQSAVFDTADDREREQASGV